MLRLPFSAWRGKAELARRGYLAHQQVLARPDVAVGGEQLTLAGHKSGFFCKAKGRKQLARGFGPGHGKMFFFRLHQHADAQPVCSGLIT